MLEERAFLLAGCLVLSLALSSCSILHWEALPLLPPHHSRRHPQPSSTPELETEL